MPLVVPRRTRAFAVARSSSCLPAFLPAEGSKGWLGISRGAVPLPSSWPFLPQADVSRTTICAACAALTTFETIVRRTQEGVAAMSASECAAAAMGVQTAAAAVAGALHGLAGTDEPPPKRQKKRPAAAKAATATETPGSSLNFPQKEAVLRVDQGGHGQGGGAVGRDLPAGSEV